MNSNANQTITDFYWQGVSNYFLQNGWKPFPFQKATWKAYSEGKNGLINAPTGSGKTYALVLPILAEVVQMEAPGLKAIWISPIRALAKEIYLSTHKVIDALGLPVSVGIRTGDTTLKERKSQKNNAPDILITTPESLHILIAQKGYRKYFSLLRCIVVDEWHELMGSKRGVQLELARAHLEGILPHLKIWGISATIGNLSEASEVLLGKPPKAGEFVFIHSKQKKKIVVKSVLPDDMESFPWAGHIGIRLLPKVIPLIESSTSTLIFTNTRSQCEIWYQRLLEVKPELAGVMAMHHSAISDELRAWVEEALHEGRLKAVVCTSSLDLGVDFRPVETVVQIGSPKGVARFLQRAGRSGHSPGLPSTIYFVPTHSMELLEGAGLRFAAERQIVEDRLPHLRSFDVLVQFLMTLACSGGFKPAEIYPQVLSTFAFRSISHEEWNWTLNFLISGSQSLSAYDEYQRLGMDGNGIIRVRNAHIARRHKLSIGTIVGSTSLRIKYISGKRLGTVEEYFIANLSPGDKFWFAGRALEFVRMKGNDVLVRKTNASKAKIPSWMGGRMPLSSQMSEVLRHIVDLTSKGKTRAPEMKALKPLLNMQAQMSRIPQKDEFLIEYFETHEGFHLTCYPFEGRFVHQGLGAIMAYRLSRLKGISFSIGMNDYGLELLSDKPIPLMEALDKGLFSTKDLTSVIQRSVNEVEMARRKFRDIASIAGLIFHGFPGKIKRERHLQSSSSLLFEVFHDYDPDNLLYLQSYEEAKTFEFEEGRLRKALSRINDQHIIVKETEGPTPFAFPILVDRLRERMSSESLEERVRRMQVAMK